MQGSQERVAVCTTAVFDGLIALTQPEESWVAKWQRIGKYYPSRYSRHLEQRQRDGREEHTRMEWNRIESNHAHVSHILCFRFCFPVLFIEKRIPGLYAVKVTGQLPDDDRERLGLHPEVEA